MPEPRCASSAACKKARCDGTICGCSWRWRARAGCRRRDGRSGSTRRRSGGAIAALEEALGARLFDRSPQGYALTEAGRGLLGHAQAMEAMARAAAEEVGGQPDRLSGTVRIGAPDGVSNYLLIDACDALSRDNPDLQVQVVALPRMFVALQARGGSRDHRLAADGRAADGAQDRRLPAARSTRGPISSTALGPVSDDGRPRRRARHRLHLGHDLRPRARLLRAARARDRAGADLEQPDHAAALVPARRRHLHPAGVRRPRAPRARGCCCPTTSG